MCVLVGTAENVTGTYGQSACVNEAIRGADSRTPLLRTARSY